jgi:G3E family GTPase
MARLRALNEHAPIDTAIGGALDPRRLIEAGPDRPQPHAGFIGESGHSDGIQSFVLSEAGPLAWQPFERAMETLIAVRGSDLLRVKGFLSVAGCSGPVLVQIVQHLAHPPLELASWPDPDHASRLVFITRNISEDQVWALLRAVRSLAGTAGG